MNNRLAWTERRWLWLVLGTVLPLGCWREVRPNREVVAEDLWMGAYVNDRKIGFSHTQVRPAEWNGEAAIEVESTSVVKMALLGNPIEEQLHVLQVTDLQYAPQHLSFTMTSAV